jgi:hypothetical protein
MQKISAAQAQLSHAVKSPAIAHAADLQAPRLPLQRPCRTDRRDSFS